MQNHATLLKQLLPNSLDVNGELLNVVLQAEGNALDASVALADALLTEQAIPTALQFIPDWERILGASTHTDLNNRRAYLTGRLNETGGQNRQYFIDLAAGFGLGISIDEFNLADMLSDVMSPLFTGDWLFVWRINLNVALSQSYRESTVMDTVMEPFASWTQHADFERVLREDSPAHTALLFNYL